MDPVGSILKITAAVLRRLADGVDTPTATPTPPAATPVVINLTIHEATNPTRRFGRT